jgi:hypothetical protein
MFWGSKCGRCVGLITLPPSLSRLSRQCGILNVSQPYRPPRPAMGIALLFTTCHHILEDPNLCVKDSLFGWIITVYYFILLLDTVRGEISSRTDERQRVLPSWNNVPPPASRAASQRQLSQFADVRSVGGSDHVGCLWQNGRYVRCLSRICRFSSSHFYLTFQLGIWFVFRKYSTWAIWWALITEVYIVLLGIIPWCIYHDSLYLQNLALDEDEGDMFLQNVGPHTDYMVLYPRRWRWSVIFMATTERTLFFFPEDGSNRFLWNVGNRCHIPCLLYPYTVFIVCNVSFIVFLCLVSYCSTTANG